MGTKKVIFAAVLILFLIIAYNVFNLFPDVSDYEPKEPAPEIDIDSTESFPETLTMTYINTSKVNMRTNNRLDSKILRVLDIGTKVEVLENIGTGNSVYGYKRSPWYRVIHENTVGFIYGAFLTDIVVEINNDRTLFLISKANSNGVNVRSSSSLDADVVYRLPKGTQVLVTGQSIEKKTIGKYGNHYWYEIAYGKADGWVFGGLLDQMGSKSYTAPINAKSK